MSENPYAPPRAQVGDIEPAASLDRPRSVVIAVQLLWAGFGVGILGSVMSVFMPQSGTGLAVNLVTALISDGINFAFSYWLYTAAWRGRGWSRVVQAVLLAAGIAAYYYLRSLNPGLFQLPPFIDLIYVIANLTEIVGIAMLFAPSASVWYRVMRTQRQEMRR